MGKFWANIKTRSSSKLNIQMSWFLSGDRQNKKLEQEETILYNSVKVVFNGLESKFLQGRTRLEICHS